MIYRFSIPLDSIDNIQQIKLDFKNKSVTLENKFNYFNKKNYLKIYVSNNNLIIISKQIIKNINIKYKSN